MRKLFTTFMIATTLTGCISVQMDLDSAKIGLSNPATEFCLQQKGFVDYQTDKQGNNISMCHLPNGQEIEVWQLYRSKQP